MKKISEKKSRPYKFKVLSEANPPATTRLNSNSTITLTNIKTLTTQQQDTYSTKTAINIIGDITALNSNSTVTLTDITVSVAITKQHNTPTIKTKDTSHTTTTTLTMDISTMTTNTSNVIFTTGGNMTCTNVNTNTCTDTSTDLRSNT